MPTPAATLIQQLGETYTVRNATGSGRAGADYSDDGSIVGVIEQRGQPRTVTNSAGEDVDSDLELRAVPDDVTIRTAGESGHYPTQLVHPDGPVYRVVDTYPEDSNVTVLAVVRE